MVQATFCVLASRDNCAKATSAVGDLLQYFFRKTSHPLQASHKPRRVEKASIQECLTLCLDRIYLARLLEIGKGKQHGGQVLCVPFPWNP